MDPKIDFEFVNSQTGNTIGYLSLSADLERMEKIKQLDSKKAELATANKLNLSLIYWQDKSKSI